MHEWMQKQLIGFSVKSWAEFLRAIELGSNMVEIKLEKFTENGMPLYSYHSDGRFEPNLKNLQRIKAVAQEYDIAVQLHLPLERSANVKKETGINVGFKSHHEVALSRFIMLEEIFQRHGIGSVITVHPPTISFDGKQVIATDEALENASIFFESLDAIRLRKSHQTQIGVENQPAGKIVATCLGDQAQHFKKMLRNTRTIGTTIDSGHRLLAEDFTVTELLGFAFATCNFHFHGNEGKFQPDSYDDDQHQLPTRHNVKGFDNYIRYFRRHRTPVVLEISHLEQYEDRELKECIMNLKRETE